MKTNTLLMGRIGTGKTHSLRTIVQSEVNLRVLSLAPGIETVLGDIPCPALHWHEIQAIPLSFPDVAKFIKTMTLVSGEDLAKINDPNRMRYTGFLEVFSACQDFVCDRCGANLGCADAWDDTTCLAVDDCTALCRLSMRAVVGAKPFPTKQNYGTAQQAVMSFIQLGTNLKCSFVLLAHTDREVLHETGTVLETVHAIGQALAPQLTKEFSEVIHSKREIGRSGPEFYWSTLEPGAESKGRRLPWGERLAPSFAPLLKN